VIFKKPEEKMSVEIYPVHVGFDCCYIIKDHGVIMIDGGATGKKDAFVNGLKKLSIDPKEIKLIVITHGHWDHVGAAKEIKELTGAKIAMHKNEKGWLEKGVAPLPPGINAWGRFFIGVMGLFPSLIKVPATDVDIVLDDKAFSLEKYGIAGKVIPTPGHSHGSVSVLLDSGEAFVGDLAMNKFPLRIGPGLPIFADDLSQVKRSWKRLLELGAKSVYPAHGNHFSAEVMRRAIS
jgi:hydroxyacylglutathione hydrolase